MDHAAYRPGEQVKFEVTGTINAEKGALFKRYHEASLKLGLSFTKEDAGHIQIQFNIEAALQVGFKIGDFLKAGATLGAGQTMTLRFNSSEDAATWLAEAFHHSGEKLKQVNQKPLFEVERPAHSYDKPTKINEFVTSASLSAEIKKQKSELKKSLGAGVAAEFKAEHRLQSFLMADGSQMQGSRVTTRAEFKGQVGSVEFQAEKMRYTQTNDPVHTNNGTYEQAKFSFKVPVNALKGSVEQATNLLRTLVVSKAGAKNVSEEMLTVMAMRYHALAQKMPADVKLGLSVEWNSVEEKGSDGKQVMKPLNARVFLHLSVEKESEMKLGTKRLIEVKGALKTELSKSQLLYEKVYSRSEAYISQRYTGALRPGEWADFEKKNQGALRQLVDAQRAAYPNGSVAAAWRKAGQEKGVSDPEALYKAGLDALKQSWMETYNASRDIEKDARTIFNQLVMPGGSKTMRSFPLSASEQKDILNIIEKYKDQPNGLYFLRRQLQQWLGDQNLTSLQKALQTSSGHWFARSYNDSTAYIHIASATRRSAQ